MLNDLLLSPPIALVIMIAVVGLLALLARGLATRSNPTPGKGEPYACGQEVETGRIQPSYDEFFHFAFLFTILEVAALVVATVTAAAAWLAVVILVVIALALLILFRRD